MLRIVLAGLTFGTGAALAMGHAAWDVNGDAELSPEEFVAGFGGLDTHALFDGNSDGMLDEAEWSAGLTDVGEYVNMDLNGDGGVDAAEYNALLFNRYDTDGSGAIEAAEQELIEADLSEDGLLTP
ncbi:MAG: hypothetical protein AAF919_18860 [Pseudomonadota bacterium]